LRHSFDKSKKRFYKIFQAENIQHYISLTPKDENENMVDFGEVYAYATIMADYYFIPEN